MDNANQEVPPVVNQPAVKPSNNLSFFKILAYGFAVISIGVSIAVGGYLLGANKTKTQPTAQTSAIPSVSPTTDPTANWQTYSNTKEGFEIKYPENFYVFNVDSGSTKFYANHRRFSIGFRDSKLKDNPAAGSAFYISIYEAFNGELRNWMIDNSTPFEFGTNEYTQSRKLYYNSNNAQSRESNINGIKTLSFDLIGGYPTDETIVLLKNNSDLFEIRYQKGSGQTNIFEQILSTFKFTQ